MNDEWAAFADMMPSSFGKKAKPSNNANTVNFEKTKRQETKMIDPAMNEPPASAEKKSDNHAQSSDDDDDDDDESDNDSDEPSSAMSLEPPISHEVTLKDHTRTVSALALDPAGSRLISGGYDYDVKLWDFAGMNQSFRPFRSFQPFGDYQIHDIQYSLTGDSFLAISGASNARLFDREGQSKYNDGFMKGDPYIRDLRHTAGHVGPLSGVTWHPDARDTFATSSQDGTLRVWNVEQHRKQKLVIAYKSKERGGRSAATALAYTHNASLLAGAYQDGTIQVWDTKGPFVRPAVPIPDAHQKQSETSSLLFSKDNFTLVSRGGDDSVKVWDIRNAKKPVSVQYGLDIVHPRVNVIFSPDERLILTGTACPKDKGVGKLVMMDRNTLEIQRTMHIGPSSVVKVLWHPRINQIFTGSANGDIHAFYSPDYSHRGVKMAVSKAPKKRAVDDYEINRPIINPHALPMYREEKVRSKKRQLQKQRKDPVASHRPDLPVGKHGVGGRVAHGQQHATLKHLSKDTRRDEDPREALLRYANAPKDDEMSWVSKVYEETQPKAIFNEEEEEEAPKKKKKKGLFDIK
ncbi:WD40 repeat-like protein [Hesseltinella vesiculosa]|uniref:WD40 repeat-like protein n=1 Tax=Hesseltinella vesiculosa TaxID=101127 RepID=A0A1X2GYG7_9FUNG|nr:WD40 repeat-like protein [Hesseltinella vesiculosa]